MKPINKKVIVSLIILMMTIGQFAVTIYLPSMPAMVNNLKTDDSLIQMTVTLYVLGFGISQFIYGPLSDMYGRRTIVLIGLSLFVVGSLIAIFSPTAGVLLFARLLQGAGMGCGDAMGRAIMCDVFEGLTFVKAASYIGMASAVSPVVAPILGGYLESLFNWRASFIFLLFYGLISLGFIYFLLPETNKILHRKYCRNTYTFSVILVRYISILRNPLFIGYFIPGIAAFFGEIVYNMVAPFLIQSKLGYSPVAYGWLAIFTAGGLFLGSIASNSLSHKLSIYHMVLCGLSLLLASSLCMLFWGLLGYLSLFTLVLPMVVFMIGTGITYPNTNAGALTPFSHMAGIAGALQGGLQMAITGLLGLSVANIDEETQIPLATILVITTAIGLFIFYFLIRHRHYVESEASSSG